MHKLLAEAVAATAFLTVAGCASNSGVAPLGNGEYVVSRQAATGFSGIGDLEAKTLREADAYCSSKGMTMTAMNTNESKPPYIFGNFPRVEVRFRCVPSVSPVKPDKPTP